jgi:hypothetical protein
MKNTAPLRFAGMYSGIFVVLIFWHSAAPTAAAAQGVQGQDAVYSTNGRVAHSSRPLA